MASPSFSGGAITVFGNLCHLTNFSFGAEMFLQVCDRQAICIECLLNTRQRSPNFCLAYLFCLLQQRFGLLLKFQICRQFSLPLE